MSHYADSSFLVSCYVTDAHTAQAKAYLSAHSVPLLFTALRDLEVRNALKLGVLNGVAAVEVRRITHTQIRAGQVNAQPNLPQPPTANTEDSPQGRRARALLEGLDP